MSGVLGRTPGTITARPMTLREIGSESMTSRAITVVRVACCTSTCGAVPDTLIVSSSEPTFISALTVAVKFDGKFHAFANDRAEAGERKRELVAPGRIASKRYDPGYRSPSSRAFNHRRAG